MFHYLYGNIKGMQMNPSPKAQEVIKLATKYAGYLEMFQYLIDNEGNFIGFPEEGGLLDQDYVTIKILSAMRQEFITYQNSKIK